MAMEIISKKEVEEILNDVVDEFLIPRFDELGMSASGEWLRSLEVVAGANGGEIKGRHYTEYLAKGRPPSDKLPPVSALESWVNDKLGITGREANSIAWGIAKKIQKEGSKWYIQKGSNLLEVLQEPKTIEFIKKRIGAKLRVKIAENLVRQAKETFKK